MPGLYWSILLITRTWKNRLYRLPPKKDYHVSITTYTHDRRKSIGQKETKKRKEDKGKEEKTRKRKKTKQERKEKKRQEKQEKTRQDKKRKQGKEKRKKHVILADPRN